MQILREAVPNIQNYKIFTANKNMLVELYIMKRQTHALVDKNSLNVYTYVLN